MACDAEQTALAQATALRIQSDITLAIETAEMLIEEAINNLRRAQEQAAQMALTQCQMGGGGMLRAWVDERLKIDQTIKELQANKSLIRLISN